MCKPWVFEEIPQILDKEKFYCVSGSNKIWTRNHIVRNKHSTI